jgi:hypothetical protein
MKKKPILTLITSLFVVCGFSQNKFLGEFNLSEAEKVQKMVDQFCSLAIKKGFELDSNAIKWNSIPDHISIIENITDTAEKVYYSYVELVQKPKIGETKKTLIDKQKKLLSYRQTITVFHYMLYKNLIKHTNQKLLLFTKDGTEIFCVVRNNKISLICGYAGLDDISEFGTEDKLREKLELGKSYNFKITVFDPKEQKMALSFTESK